MIWIFLAQHKLAHIILLVIGKYTLSTQDPDLYV